MSHVSIAFRAPAVGLRRYISTYYELAVEGDEPLVDYLHPEWANIRIPLDQPWEMGLDGDGHPIMRGMSAVLHGPTSKPTYVRGTGISFGVGILPPGWNRLWTKDAATFANGIAPLSDLIGEDANAQFETEVRAATNLDARAAFADQFLTNRIEKAKVTRLSVQIDNLFQVLIDPANATVEQLTDTLGLPQSRLARLSKRGFGFPPKHLLRRQRFLRMLGTLHARPYSEWPDFIDPQYVDQSHMVRDFQYFLGMSPKAYFAMPRPILAAATQARAAMFGQPLQGLHQPGQR